MKIQIQNLNIKINLRQAPNHIDQDHLKQKPLLRIKKTVQAAQVQVMTQKRMSAQLRDRHTPVCSPAEELRAQSPDALAQGHN